MPKRKLLENKSFAPFSHFSELLISRAALGVDAS